MPYDHLGFAAGKHLRVWRQMVQVCAMAFFFLCNYVKIKALRVHASD